MALEVSYTKLESPFGGSYAYFTTRAAQKDYLVAGPIVCGYGADTGDVSEFAFAWTPDGGFIDLHPDPMYSESYANAISRDGAFVFIEADNGRYGFRWSQGAGFEALFDDADVTALLGAGFAVHLALASVDGGIASGHAVLVNDYRAVRWTPGGGLVMLPTTEADSKIEAMAADGSRACGWHGPNAATVYACYWDGAGSAVQIHDPGVEPLATTAFGSNATAISSDGAVIVGHANCSFPPGTLEPGSTVTALRAFRWTSADGMVPLGTLGGHASYWPVVSPDGSYVAGGADDPGNASQPYLWTEADGMQAIDIASLGGTDGAVSAIDNDGTAYGWFTHSDGTTRNFVRTAAGEALDMGFAGGTVDDYNYGVYAGMPGVMVGEGGDADSEFVWVGVLAESVFWTGFIGCEEAT